MASSSFKILFTFFVFFQLVCSSPIPNASESVFDLEKRTAVGRGTWYEPGLGNCGWNNSGAQDVLAISKSLYDRNGGSNCGQWVEIVNTKNGNTAYGYTVDSCGSCADNDLDMSPSLFQKLDALSTGVLEISWHFMPKGQ